MSIPRPMPPVIQRDPDQRRETPVMLGLILLIALAAAAPLWGPGMVNTRGGGDSPFLLARTVEIAAALRHGIIPVRWMAHAAYDLGYPFFNHYAALPFYISGGLHALGLDLLLSIQITQTLGFVVAALAINLWLRRIWPGKAARLLAVAAYTFAPFHLVNVYVRGDSLSEFYAFAMYPLILWALDRVAKEAVARPSATVQGTASRTATSRRVGAVVTAGLAYGALALTHNVSFLIFSPFALLYGLGPIWQRSRDARREGGPLPTHHWARSAAILATAFAVGMLFTVWFWLPALSEITYGQMGPAFTEDYFNFSNHFRGADLVQPTLPFNYTVATSTSEAGPFAMGLAQALLALAGAGVLAVRLARGRADARHGTLLLSLGIATLMITPLSRPLWEHLPLLATTQFPWRFLSVQALFTAAVTGTLGAPRAQAVAESGARAGPGQRQTAAWAAAAAGALLIAWAGLAFLRPERLMIRAEDVTREALLLYESFTGNIGTTIRYEYLPRDVVPRLYISEAVIDGQGALRTEGEGQLKGQLLARTPVRQTWQVTLPAASEDTALRTVVFPVNWWPGWRVSVDGAQVQATPLTGSGRLAIDLVQAPDRARTFTVTLRLRDTALARYAGAVSGLALTAALAAWALQVHRARQDGALALAISMTAAEHKRHALWGMAIVAASVLGPVTLSQLQPAPDGPATFFDFVRMPFPHRGPVEFGSAQLIAAQIAAPGDAPTPNGATASPGETLTVSLDWMTLPSESLTSTLRLVTPAAPRHGVDIPLVEARAAITDSTQISLSLPHDLARGLYFVQLQVDGPAGTWEPRTPAGHGMSDLYIGAIRIPEGPALPSDAPVLAAFRDLTLHSLTAEQNGPHDLQLKFGWSTAGTPRNWQFSLRLLDSEGHQIVSRDDQPGYGYLPTTLWQPGELVTDRTVLPLPVGLAPGDYILRIIPYLLATMEDGGEADIPIRLEIPTRYDLRDACCEYTRKGATILCQAGRIAMLGLALPDTIAEGEDLRIDAEWNAMLPSPDASEAPGDLMVTWQLVDKREQVVAETTRPPAPGSRTEQWPLHTWVKSALTLPLPPRLDAGPYVLHVMLQEAGSEPVACGELAGVTVTPRPRDFAAPALAHAQEAEFGSELGFLGFEIDARRRAGGYRPVTPDRLVMTLWWQAKETPERDYKRFVHLYDAESEQVLAQDDAIPRGWTYPTTWWAPHEVVSETVTLDLTGVPAGTYRLGVGWYDPETLERLPATTTPPSAASHDRLILEAEVTIR